MLYDAISPDVWLAFAIASAALLAIPGPTVLLVISAALSRGRVTGWATVPGVTLGDFTAMTVSLAGAGAVLAASATLFTLLKLAGAAYLIWLGIQLWRNPPAPFDPAAGKPPAAPRGELRKLFWSAYVVTALNPKSIVFFIAFVPQFIDPTRALLPQIAVLEATFLALAAINTALWAVLAGEMRRRFARPSAMRLVGRIGGGCMIGAGLLTALARRGT